MTTKARAGITLMQLAEMFPDDAAAERWFESRFWTDGRKCGRCGSDKTVESKHPKMPYWCSEGRHYFSVRTGTVLERSKVPLRKWVYAIYLHLTSLKGVSSHKLARDIGVTQTTAWFMLGRIRKSFEDDRGSAFGGPVEVDETYVGGKSKNMHAAKRLNAGRGTVGKTAVVGAKDRQSGKVRAKVIKRTDKITLHGFVREAVKPQAQLYTDEATAYQDVRWYHEAVRHSVGEYVRDQAHTNGIESFWAMLKRAYVGTYHQISAKHLHRYVCEFAGRHNVRPFDTIDQMGELARGMQGKRLPYAELVA